MYSFRNNNVHLYITNHNFIYHIYFCVPKKVIIQTITRIRHIQLEFTYLEDMNFI